MRKILLLMLVIFIAAFIGSFFIIDANAKVLPRFQKTSKPSSGKSTGGSPTVSARLRKDRRAINVYFRNLSQTTSIFYTLSYQTNGKDEGVAGSIDPAGATSVNREILFGTCSSGVCSYHGNIKNARFEATFTLSSGKKLIKRFRIRV